MTETDDHRARLLTLPLTFLLALFLVGTSRWGSYLGIPGAPFFISDMVVALATLQIAVLVGRRQTSLSCLAGAPLALMLTGALLCYSGLRLVAQFEVSTDVLRDFAPYGYAAVAVLSFLLPVRDEARWRPVIYGVLIVHAGWAVLLPRVPGFPWQLPTLGSDATLLVARPDFDTTVLGVGAALAVFDLLFRVRSGRPVVTVSLVGFAVFSVLGMSTLSTRAGMIAGLLAIASVVIAWVTVRWGGGAVVAFRSSRRTRTLVMTFVALAMLGSVVALSPTGSRLVEGIYSTSSEANGTVEVRKTVWSQVSSYVLRDAGRTAVGVGFGPNFIDDSGSRIALEGSTYQNVRSPHNYVVGTLARLGVAGALLVVLIMLLAGWLGVSRLCRRCGPVSALAALLVISLPVTALLGVVFESPFGAITYFWAIGQLSYRSMSSRLGPTEAKVQGE